MCFLGLSYTYVIHNELKGERIKDRHSIRERIVYSIRKDRTRRNTCVTTFTFFIFSVTFRAIFHFI